MYLEHFSLKIKPFQITVDPKFLWLGEKHQEALATLRYGIADNRGFLLLTGEVGTGKTILINRLISLLDMDTVVATLPDPDLECMDFYNLLADGFKMNRRFDSKGEFLIHLRDFLHQSYANNQRVLLIIDESQRLNHRLMEDIRVLSNIELQDRKLINIFFVGQQEFNSILLTPQNRALSQRITVRYHIEALDESETGAYIRHRLEVAGSQEKIFEKTAIAEVYQVSGGIPRLINIVCDHALLTTYAQGSKKVDGKIIKECAEELRIPIQKPRADAASVRSVDEHLMVNGGGLSGTEALNGGPKPFHSPSGGQAVDLPEEEKNASSIRKVVYVVVILMLIGGAAFLIDRFAQRPALRHAEEEVTSNKLIPIPEMEKARPEDHLIPLGKQSGDTQPLETQKNKDSKREVGLKPISEEGRGEDDSVDSGIKSLIPKKLEQKEHEAEIKPFKTGKVIIPFNINSNEIDRSSYPELDRIAAYMANHPELVLHVKGFTDDSGSEGFNESVSRFRAVVVKSYLIGKGVDPDKAKVFAMGGANPLASNSSYEGRKKNRRVEIVLQKDDAENN